MTVKTILKMGNPALHTQSAIIPLPAILGQPTQTLIKDMFDTMQAVNGAGLAAPQIGHAVRVIVFGSGTANPRYPGRPSIEPQVLINPHIAPLSTDKNTDFEGCLSVPGLRGQVPRYTSIRYTGYNEKGEFISRTVCDFHARVVQHEVDHLDGILYPQRIENYAFFGFNEEIERHHF